MRKTKVLAISYEYPPIGGGTAKACQNITERVSEYEEVEIYLITSSRDTYCKEFCGDNLTVERLNVNKDSLNDWKFREIGLFILKSYFRGRKILNREDYDLIHSWTGFPCGLVGRLLREDYFIGLRGGDVPGFDERFEKFYPFLKPLFKNIWSNAEIIVPNSEGLKELAQESFDFKMNFIPNGVDTAKFPPKSSYSKSLNTIQLVVASRLASRKRISDVIRAIEDLDSFELTVIGDGEEKDKLMSLVDSLNIADRVNFEGYIENRNLSSYLASSDIYVLPSLNEGMSNSLLEAVSSGLPIITTDVGGSDTLVNGNGFIVDKKSPDSIRNVLTNYKENPDLLEKHGRKSREIAENNSWDNVAGEYLQLYQNLC